MAAFKDVIKKIDVSTFEDMIKAPIHNMNQASLSKILRQIGITKWAEITGRYFDNDISDEMRDFIDGEITLLYYLSNISKNLGRGINNDFKEIIERIDQNFIFNIAMQPIVLEDKNIVRNEVVNAKWITFLLNFYDLAKDMPEVQRFVRGIASCFYYLLKLKDAIEIEKQFELE